ncbi:MAG: ferric reductase-like transmembrane domain-containing protein [Patescibacteria group bacterium]|nr:ferric reductase-like transmembrane domain-containing protein [Patescibacteria group bacterium]
MKIFSKSFFIWTILFLVLAGIPFILWILAIPLSVRFTTTINIWRSLGQICGLVGLSFLVGNIILSSRAKFLERWFSGLNFVYLKHHWLGTLAFCLLLVHPLALAYRFVSRSLKAAAELLIPSFHNLPVLFGIVALLGLMFLLVLTYFFRPSYQRWLFSHKFMVLVFVLTYPHILLVPSDVSAFLPLQLYYYLLGILAVVGIIYRLQMTKKAGRRFSYTISEITQPQPDLFDITLQSLGKPVLISGGQFAFFTFYNPELPTESHPFSLVERKENNDLRIVIKKLGDFTKKLAVLKIGDRVLVEGPFGSFGKNISGPELWLAGGIGLTPFLSLAKEINKEKDIVLIQSWNKPAEVVFNSELADSKNNFKNFKSIVWVAEASGFLNGAAIEKLVPDWRERTILICGPVGMMQAIRGQLKKMGGKSKKIISENFNL